MERGAIERGAGGGRKPLPLAAEPCPLTGTALALPPSVAPSLHLVPEGPAVEVVGVGPPVEEELEEDKTVTAAATAKDNGNNK